MTEHGLVVDGRLSKRSEETVWTYDRGGWAGADDGVLLEVDRLCDWAEEATWRW